MCLICIEFKKEALTVREAWGNLREMKDGMTDEHYDEVVSMLVEGYEAELDAILSDDGDDLEEILNNLEQDREHSFEWDLRLPDDQEQAHEENSCDFENPWYIPGFED